MEPRKLTARVAVYLDSIASARRRGITWAELAAVLGAASGPALRAAARRARIAIESGRIVPGEQLPLPEPPTAPARGPAPQAPGAPPPGTPPFKRPSAQEALEQARQYSYPSTNRK